MIICNEIEITLNDIDAKIYNKNLITYKLENYKVKCQFGGKNFFKIHSDVMSFRSTMLYSIILYQKENQCIQSDT